MTEKQLARKYHVEGYNESFQLIPYLKRSLKPEDLSKGKWIEELPDPEIVKKDAMQLKALMKKAHCYLGFTVPVSYQITASYIKGDDLLKYGEKPLYIMRLNDDIIMEEATFTTEELIESMKKGKDYVKKKSE